MLRKMRSDFKKYSWTLWLVIIAFVLGFSITGVFSKSSIEKSDLLSIDGKVVKGNDFYLKMRQTIDLYRNQFKENFNKSLLLQLRIPEQILNSMINSAIIQKELVKMRIRVSDEELKEKIKTFPAFQRDGSFIGFEAYKNVLAQNRIHFTDFEKELKVELAADKLKEFISLPLVIGQEELKELYKKEKDKSEIEYFLLQPDLIKEEVSVSEAELSAYYDQNKDKFKTKEQRDGAVIFYRSDDYKKDIMITDTELYDFFKKNKEMFIEQGKTKVSRIFLPYTESNREEIYKKAEEIGKELTKDNFSIKAKELSQDKKATEGGDWGYWEWKNFTPQETKFVESLDQGEISTPVDTRSGFSLLMVSEKVPQNMKPFAEVKENIHKMIERERLSEIVGQKMTQLYKQLKDEKNLKERAGKLGEKIIDTGLVTEGQNIKDIEDMGAVSRQLFSMKKDEISQPFELMKGMALVQLTNIKEPKVEEFARVKDRVKDYVIKDKKIILLEAKARQYINELNQISDEKKREEYMKKNNFTKEDLTYKRGNQFAQFPAIKGLDDIIFSVSENRFVDPLKMNDSVVLYKVKSKFVTGVVEFENDKKVFYAQQIKELQERYFASYIMNLRKSYDENKKIYYNAELFKKITDKIFSEI